MKYPNIFDRSRTKLSLSVTKSSNIRSTVLFCRLQQGKCREQLGIIQFVGIKASSNIFGIMLIAIEPVEIWNFTNKYLLH